MPCVLVRLLAASLIPALYALPAQADECPPPSWALNAAREAAANTRLVQAQGKLQEVVASLRCSDEAPPSLFADFYLTRSFLLVLDGRPDSEVQDYLTAARLADPDTWHDDLGGKLKENWEASEPTRFGSFGVAELPKGWTVWLDGQQNEGGPVRVGPLLAQVRDRKGEPRWAWFVEVEEGVRVTVSLPLEALDGASPAASTTPVQTPMDPPSRPPDPLDALSAWVAISPVVDYRWANHQDLDAQTSARETEGIGAGLAVRFRSRIVGPLSVLGSASVAELTAAESIERPALGKQMGQASLGLGVGTPNLRAGPVIAAQHSGLAVREGLPWSWQLGAFAQGDAEIGDLTARFTAQPRGWTLAAAGGWSPPGLPLRIGANLEHGLTGFLAPGLEDPVLRVRRTHVGLELGARLAVEAR